jgi:hypothetical protein
MGYVNDEDYPYGMIPVGDPDVLHASKTRKTEDYEDGITTRFNITFTTSYEQ